MITAIYQLFRAFQRSSDIYFIPGIWPICPRFRSEAKFLRRWAKLSGQATRRALPPFPRIYITAHPGLEEGVDQELIPEAVSPLAGGRRATDLLPGEVRGDTLGLWEQYPVGNEGPLRNSKLDKSLFGPTLLLVACGCQAQNAGQREGAAAKIGQKGFFCLINDIVSISARQNPRGAARRYGR